MPADPVLPHYRITHLPHHHCTQQPASFLLTTQPLPLYNLTLPSLKWKEMYPWQYKPIFCIKCTSILYNRYEVYSKTNATVTIAAPTFIWDIGLRLYLGLCMTKKSCEDSFFLQISWLELGWPVHSLLPLPLPGNTMTDVRNFVAGLPQPGKVLTRLKKQQTLPLGIRAFTNSQYTALLTKLRPAK